jgi:hypothetical protein
MFSSSSTVPNLSTLSLVNESSRPGEFDISTTSLSLDLPWLKKLDAEILEIPAAHPDSSALLYDADVQILVTSPLATPLPRSFESLLSKPGSFLVLNYPTLDQQVADFTVSRLSRLSPTVSDALKAKLLHVYPPKAFSALDLFHQGSTSADAIQAFQDDFMGSGVPVLSQSISQALSLEPEARRSRYAQLILTGALEACRDAVEDASRDVTAVRKHVEELQARVYDAQGVSVLDVLGGDEAPEVGKALRSSTRDVQPVIDALQWWKLPLKVDDLGDTLSRAIERAWCRGLEAKVHFL